MLGFIDEKRLFKSGYKFVAGIDEAGRGPLAGPVVAACVVCRSGFRLNSVLLEQVDDSKKLRAKKREAICKAIMAEKFFKVGVGIRGQAAIDRLNILQATFSAMREAVRKSGCQPEFLLVDGNQRLPRVNIKQKAVTYGDKKIFLIAAASIVAKVTRDRLMVKWHKKYPDYRFDRNKGYGTKEHLNILNKRGPCPLHRKSFAPAKYMTDGLWTAGK